MHYDGYQVIRALPHSQDQLDTLHTIGESADSEYHLPSDVANVIIQRTMLRDGPPCPGWRVT